MHLSSIITAVIFVGWLGTLGMRLSSGVPQTPGENAEAQQTQLANVMNGTYASSQLQVATSTDSAADAYPIDPNQGPFPADQTAQTQLGQ